MARKENVVAKVKKAYAEAMAEEAEELQGAIVEVLNEHGASIPNTLYVLDIIRFQYMQAKYKEIMGVVKLSDKPPLKRK